MEQGCGEGHKEEEKKTTDIFGSFDRSLVRLRNRRHKLMKSASHQDQLGDGD